MNKVARMWLEECGDKELMILTLYEKPVDFPNHYVIRANYAGQAGVRMSRGCMLFTSEEETLRWVGTHFPDLTPVPRSYEDEPQIMGSWL